MSKVDTILFDWDGTLAQTLELWLKTFKEAYNKVGVHPTDRDISSRFGKWDAYKELGVALKDEKEYNDYLEIVYERLEHVKLYPGVEKVLKRLRNDGYKLGLVTTSRLKMLETALKNEGVVQYFDAVVTADDTDKHKPDPTSIYIALDKLNSSADKAIFVGDSDKDTGASYNAKVPLLLFVPPQHELYYDLQTLKTEPAVIASFEKWEDFPFESIE